MPDLANAVPPENNNECVSDDNSDSSFNNATT
ncbi:MAG: hypothetical protein ACI8SC_000840 [Colwellia sp.]|jgi:hypothetical protein